VTQGRESSGARLNEGAERLLESLTGSIVQEARRAAVRRNDPASEVSPIDIVTTLESKRDKSRKRDRSAFAVQVLGTAVSLSAVVIVLSGGLFAVAVGHRKVGADQVGSFFTTVLLALLTVVTATLLIFRIGDLPNGLRGQLSRGSRYKDELALLAAWQAFEDAMHRSVEEDDADSKSERLDLSSVISKFADRYGVDPKHVKKILGIRNAVAHRTSRVSAKEVRSSLEDLRKLNDVLGFSDHGIRGGSAGGR
jgi:hypothetical protein